MCWLAKSCSKFSSKQLTYKSIYCYYPKKLNHANIFHRVPHSHSHSHHPHHLSTSYFLLPRQVLLAPRTPPLMKRAAVFGHVHIMRAYTIFGIGSTPSSSCSQNNNYLIITENCQYHHHYHHYLDINKTSSMRSFLLATHHFFIETLHSVLECLDHLIMLQFILFPLLLVSYFKATSKMKSFQM